MNIVPGPVERLSSALLTDVHAAWKKLAAGRMAPRRDEITPALIKSALPSIWMIDVVDGGRDFRFRIAGDRIIQFMGRRYAGSLLSEFAEQPFFQHMREILTTSVRSKRPFVAGPGRSRMPGKEHVELEVLVLPLSDDGEHVTTVFGAMEIGPLRAKKLPKGQP
ncbi:MAG TPA: PAS domain-containing protein [Rhizomicrobium sp.]|nr:PAS domain-containing protein [Rhizomicrobium sp.]